jgi:predicted outer membrane lipoprotein
MWFEIWVVTIALAIGFVVTAQIIEHQGDAARRS